jgi:hypothetical protein
MKYIILLIFIIFIITLFTFKVKEEFNILDYQFSQENTPLFVPPEATLKPTSFQKYFSINRNDRGPWELSKNLNQPAITEQTREIEIDLPNPVSANGIPSPKIKKTVIVRRQSEYIQPSIKNIVEIPKEIPKPKLIDYQFSEFNFPSYPLDSMKVTPHRPWTDTKQVDKYIIPQTLTPYATNLYKVYYNNK